MIGRGIGNVVRTLGELVEARLPFARLGDGVSIRPHSGAAITGRVIAIRDRLVTLAPLGPLDGIAVGDRVEADPLALAALLGTVALGRAFDAGQTPLDEGPPLAGRRRYMGVSTPSPAERRPIDSPLWTGIRVIDGLLAIGRGARVGIFGEPGAGKSTLLEMIVQGVAADAVVLALIGERGREAQTWLERVDRRTTLICATADRSAGERMRAAELAMLQAEQLRARGLHVVLVVDSLARYVAALREQRISLGEPVGRGGYPAAVFAELARYLERAGNDASGSISIVATVLSDGADEREPLSDAARALLDGHLALSHDLARAGHYPAIDVLASASRTMGSVVDSVHREDAALVREALAILAQTADARRLGLADASDARLRQAMEIEPLLSAFLRQREADDPANSRRLLADLATHLRR